MPVTASDPISGAAYYVRRIESFGALLAFELDRVALVQSLISVLLNRREVYEDVLTGGTLDKSISFGSVEPLDHAIFLQANSLSHLIKHLEHPWRHPEQPLSVCGKSWLTWNALRDETITPIGLPSVSNRELLFELDDVMAGIGIECKRNLPAGTTRSSPPIRQTVGRL
jgi:hypothetical protein